MSFTKSLDWTFGQKPSIVYLFFKERFPDFYTALSVVVIKIAYEVCLLRKIKMCKIVEKSLYSYEKKVIKKVLFCGQYQNSSIKLAPLLKMKPALFTLK